MTPKVLAATKAKGSSRPKRKKARRACSACQRAHLTCDDERPCQRCIKRNIQDACCDAKRKDKSKNRSRKAPTVSESTSAPAPVIEHGFSQQQAFLTQSQSGTSVQSSSSIQNGGMQFAPQSSNSPNLDARMDQQTAQIRSSSTLMPSFGDQWESFLISHMSSGAADTPPGENGNSNSMFQNQANMTSASFLTPQDTPSGYTGSFINSEAQEPLMNDRQDRRYYIRSNNTDLRSLNQVASPFLEIEAEEG